MTTVYESLKVKLQRSKNDPVLAGVKHTYSSHLDEKIDELAQRTIELKGTIKHRVEEIRKKRPSCKSSERKRRDARG